MLLPALKLPRIKPAPIEEWCDPVAVHLKTVCPVADCSAECHIILDELNHKGMVARWLVGDRGMLEGLKRQMSEKYWQHLGREH